MSVQTILVIPMQLAPTLLDLSYVTVIQDLLGMDFLAFVLL